MFEKLDEQYLGWLYSRVASERVMNPKRTYWNLFRQMFKKEFVWFVPNDDNRVADGKALRYEFLDELRIEDIDPEWMDLGCSVLEMLIALSRHLAFQGDGNSRDWFWKLLENLNLENCTDDARRSAEAVDEVLDRVIWRTYLPSGRGGLFPLKEPHEDQRKVEIWYQLGAYLLERL